PALISLFQFRVGILLLVISLLVHPSGPGCDLVCHVLELTALVVTMAVNIRASHERAFLIRETWPEAAVESNHDGTVSLPFEEDLCSEPALHARVLVPIHLFPSMIGGLPAQLDSDQPTGVVGKIGYPTVGQGETLGSGSGPHIGIHVRCGTHGLEDLVAGAA